MVVRATVVAVVPTVVGAAVVVGASVVLVVVEVLDVVVVLVVVLVLVVELGNVDTSVAGVSATTGEGSGGCTVNGAVTRPIANRLPKTPSGTCAHKGQLRNAAQDRLADVIAKHPHTCRPTRPLPSQS